MGIIVALKLVGTWPFEFVKLPMLARFAVFSNLSFTFYDELKF